MVPGRKLCLYDLSTSVARAVKKLGQFQLCFGVVHVEKRIERPA